jgi:hypothetical protein
MNGITTLSGKVCLTPAGQDGIATTLNLANWHPSFPGERPYDVRVTSVSEHGCFLEAIPLLSYLGTQPRRLFVGWAHVLCIEMPE